MGRDAIIVVGCGWLQGYVIREAQALGLSAIATDANPHAMYVDRVDEFYPVSTYDVDGHRRLAKSLLDSAFFTIRGCVTNGADVAPTVAAVCEVLGTPGIPYAVAKRTHNKYEVRKALDDEGLERYQPAWVHVEVKNTTLCLLDASAEERFAKEHLAAMGILQSVEMPLVMKPLSQRASRGISIVRNAKEYVMAEKNVRTFGNEWLEEAYLIGTEHSAEILLRDGECLYFNMDDRFFTYTNGIPLEIGHVNPSQRTPDAWAAVRTMVLDAARALGVTWGPFKVDVCYTADGPKILECTARPSGLFAALTPRATGQEPLKALVQLACGMPVDAQLAPTHCTPVATAAILPQKSGIVQRYPAWNYLTPVTKALIDDVAWSVRVGDTIAPASHNGERAGFVFASGPTGDVAWQRTSLAAEALAVGIEVA